MNKKITLRRSASLALVFVLLFCSMTIPTGAVESVYQKNEIVETEFGLIEVETVLTVYNSLNRSNTKSADYTQTVKFSGNVVAEVTLSATFGYDGKTAWVSSASGSRTTYYGWTYGSEKITKSGGTAKLTATLSHVLHRSIPISASLTCSPTGQIS